MKTITVIAILFLSSAIYAQSDSSKYAELTAEKGDMHGTEKFDLYLSGFTENGGPTKLPYIYPLDALNYLANKGWRLVCVFTAPDESGKAIRHYELEKRK